MHLLVLPRPTAGSLKFPMLAAVAAMACLMPMGAFAHSYGPKPRVTGAPGDDALACTACHRTNTLNSGPGSVKILAQSGTAYIPGVKQRITILIADANQQRWGFELTARLNSDATKSAAGEFTSVDNFTQVICEDYGAKPCLTGPMFATHTSAGSRPGLKGAASFQIDWTPPSTNAGPVTFYVAANAADGNNTNANDQIYTASLQLTPAIPAMPTVSATGIVNGATNAAGPVAPNTWVTVYGTNLSATTRAWSDADIINGALPLSMDGVSVLLVSGDPRLAFVSYVSPTQVNFLLPPDTRVAASTIQVRNAAGLATAVPITIQANAPQVFTTDGKSVLSAHATGALVSKTAPAAPGETVMVYATGLGATATPLVTGQVATAAVAVTTAPTVTIGGAAATVASATVVPGAAGLYQINVQVPAAAANGDLPLVVQQGTASSVSATITVAK